MKDKFKSCCFTGYRPQKFPFGLKPTSKEYALFENKLLNAIFSLPKEECFTFYSGMAMGFDIIAAELVLLLRKSYKEAKISLVCAIPFLDQSSTYSEEWKKRYDKILKEADKVLLLADKYYPQCYQRRNEYMVNQSDFVITWFDGKSGGTKNTLVYAKKNGKKIINLNENGVHEYIYDKEYEVTY